MNEPEARDKQMAPRETSSTRRILIKSALASFAAGFCARLSNARASDKMTKAQAEYQGTPNGIYSCGQCTLFVAPSSCKVVEGEISSEGWCKAFVLAD